MSAFRAVGLDLSLTSTGYASVVVDDGIVTHCKARTFTSSGRKDADLHTRWHRLATLEDIICGEIDFPDLILIEQPAYSRTIGSQHDRSGLWWLIVSHLIDRDAVVVEVAPTGRAKYATGKGNASKDQVLAAAVKRFPDWDITGNDVADAVILAAMGARHLGHPIDQMPAAHLTAMAAVRWPTTSGAAA